MLVHVVDAHHHRVRTFQVVIGAAPLGEDHRTVADVHLGAVIPDANPQREAEGVAEPGNRLPDVRVRKLWNDRAAGYRPVRQHSRLHHVSVPPRLSA
jgi:hypothetical protein